MIFAQFNPEEYVRLVESNEFVDHLCTFLKKAEHVIHLQMYIFDDDKIGKKITSILKSQAQKGVRVYVLLDSFGSSGLSNSFIQELSESGIHLDFFRPLLPFKQNWGLGHRLHRKVIVVDQIKALVGGINISEKFFANKSQKDWLDFALEVGGPQASLLHRICENTWIHRNALKEKDLEHYRELQSQKIRILENYWIANHRQIYKTYLSRINAAQKSILIMTAYFFPGTRIRRALMKARKRGVKVEVILGKKIDVPILGFATRYLYRKLLANNIIIREYSPSHVHAKTCLVDDAWLTLGSYNLDSLSKYGNLELNIEVEDETFTKDFAKHLQKYILDSEVVDLKTITNKNIFSKLMEWLSYRFLRWIFIMPIFYSLKNPRKK